ncbi:2-C-methyl-D-erythritol 4-phosphate cytidylyltransferase [candidate division WOR-3 bacterium]|nr:2-C-methyl-D-erythritol 4-phosphate cytidylyltransferase [candidate division WOR-3 bacterium]
MPVHVIVVAAGQGKRFGGAKQFYLINGRPLLYYSIVQFEKNKHIASITVAVPRQTVNTVNKCIREWDMHKIQQVVAGGKRRQDSVNSGLQAIRARRGIVVIHDGARPCVSQRVITRGLQLCRRYKAVICGLPVCDTVKYVQKNHVKHTLPRTHLYTVQTPQFFDLATLRFAYDKAGGNGNYTDDAALVEAAGIPVHIFKGDDANIKVTHRRDIKRIFTLLQCKKS